MEQPALILSEKKIQTIVWTLLSLSPIIGMAVDLVAPSLPAIAQDLNISNGLSKGIISIYLLGYALGNFFSGFLTDAFGRIKILRFGVLGFSIISILPVFFPQIEILLLARFLQGITIGAFAVVARAIFSDILSPEKLVRFGTIMATMWGIGPVIGPAIGGYLQFYIGWKAGFIFFGAITFLQFIAIIINVPETHFNRHPLRLSIMKKNLLEVVSDKFFMAIIAIMGLTYSLLVSFNTIGPFLIQNGFHYSPVFFGHLAFFLGIIFLISTICCRYSLKKFQFDHIYLVIINLFFFIALLLLPLSYFFLEKNILLTAVGSGLMFFGCGFIFPMAMGKGLSFFRHIAGTATATMFLINILITSLVSFLLSFVNVQTNTPLMGVYFLLIALVSFIYWKYIRKSTF